MKALQNENCSGGEREKKERREVREGAPAVFPGEAVPAAVLLLGALSPRRRPPPGGSVVGDAVGHGPEQPWLRAGHRLQLGLISWEVLVSRSC